MELKTLENISTERNITKRLLMKWHANGYLKCVRTSCLVTTDEWLDECINTLAEKPQKQNVKQFKPINKPLQKVVGLKVH